MKMNLANKLTIFRIILVPIMAIIPFFNFDIKWIVIDIIFILASITDKLDGYIARSKNQITTFGKFLDPIADKILVLAAMLILVEDNRLPAIIPIIVLFREFIVSGYRLVAVEKGGKVIAASVWGKLKTVTQMLALILAFVDQNGFAQCFVGGLTGFAWWYNFITTILMSVSVVAAVLSGIDYIAKGKDLFKEEVKTDGKK
jgi:CDP-diacylglycerol--glycerol-3-phosphate 3-phosphatidyltransferase